MNDTQEGIKKPQEGVPTLKNGNPINRKGRPRKSTNIYSAEAIKKMENMGFCPLTALINQYEDICRKLEEMEEGKRRSSALAMANLESLKKQISETLMKYSYRPAPTSSEAVIETKTPLKITLAGLDDEEEEAPKEEIK